MPERFIFDPAKSRHNLIKHWIDFVQAQTLWRDEDRLEVRARWEREARWLVVANVDGRHWSAIVTYRGDLIRIISVRRARPKEVYWYESGKI